MKNKIQICLVALLPWVASIAALVYFIFQAREAGRLFVVRVHGFGWMLDMFAISMVWLIVFLFALIIIIVTRKSRRDGWSLFFPLLIVCLSVFVPLGSVGVLQFNFFSAREAAYMSLGSAAIYQDCLTMRGLVGESQEYIRFERNDDSDIELPPAIDELSPMTVLAASGYVVIKLDGGGIMYEEGIVAFFKDTGHLPLPENDFMAMDESLPIYRFRLDDFRTISNFVPK